VLERVVGLRRDSHRLARIDYQRLSILPNDALLFCASSSNRDFRRVDDIPHSGVIAVAIRQDVIECGESELASDAARRSQSILIILENKESIGAFVDG